MRSWYLMGTEFPIGMMKKPGSELPELLIYSGYKFLDYLYICFFLTRVFSVDLLDDPFGCIQGINDSKVPIYHF